MAKPELTVTINTRIAVDNDTANMCLKLVETYVNNTGADILCDKSENGELKFYFKEDNNNGN